MAQAAGVTFRQGVTINLISKDEARVREEIEQHFGIALVPLPDDLSKINA